MNARQVSRVQRCGAREAEVRLEHAEAFLEVARLTAEERDEAIDYGNVSVALAVLSGIAAVDAACCESLGKRSRSQNHKDAVTLVSTIGENGRQAGSKLSALLELKDTAQYGLVSVSEPQVKKAIRSAEWLVSWSEGITLSS